MKRVLSIRIKEESIAQCYDVVSKVLNEPGRLGMSSIVVGALEAILLSLERVGEVQPYTEDAAIRKIEQILGPTNGWPGQAAQKLYIHKLIGEKEPLKSVEKATVLPPSYIEEQQDLFTNVPEPLPPVATDSSQDLLQRKILLQEAIEAKMSALEKEQDEALAAALSVEGASDGAELGQVLSERVAPWESAAMLHEDDEWLVKHEVWKAALSIDESMRKAVRTVCAMIPRKDWNSEHTIALIKDVYKTYKEWTDEQGQK